jgi:cytochrome b561
MQKRVLSPGVLARLALDLGLTTAMLALFSFHLTGLTWHEWLGIGLCVLVPVHMLVSWSSLAAATRRFCESLPWSTRLTYLLNAALFASLVVVTITGFAISEVVTPSLPSLVGNRGFWRVLHSQSSNATVLLMGLHLAIYWRTLTGLVKRIVGKATGQETAASRRASAEPSLTKGAAA